MADELPVQESSSMWERVGDTISQGVSYTDRMTGSMVDTMTGGSTNMDQLSKSYANSSMLADMLTGNNPTVNVQMGMEVVCDIIAAWKESDSFSQFMKNMGKRIKSMVMGMIYQIGRTLVTAMYNIVLKLRRMLVAKINQFLAEYVADACLVGLQRHLSDIANPNNALSVKEFTSSVSDMMADMKKNVDSVMETMRTLWETMYNTLTGSKYAEAKKAYEELKAAKSAEVSSAFAAYSSSLSMGGNPYTAAIAFNVKMDEIREKYDAKLQAMENRMAVMNESSIWSSAFWAKKSKQAIDLLVSLLCSRTHALSSMVGDGLLDGMHDDIRNFLQGCLFQQALKTANKVSPNSITTDVMNRINKLSNEGNMFDAYNVAMAAGIDLKSSAYRIELPSANSWVSSVYGDPYMFAAETPINSEQVASMLMTDMPTVTEMITGDVNSDTAGKEWFQQSYSDVDSASASMSSKLTMAIAENNALIDGANARARESYEGAFKTTTEIGRDEFHKEFLRS